MPGRAIRLTKRTVDALRPNGKDTVLWDRDLKGFGVRMLASGRKVFVVQSRGPGGSKRASLGRHGKLTVEQARQRAAAAIGQIKRGEPPLAEPSGPVGSPARLEASRISRCHALYSVSDPATVFTASAATGRR